MLRVTFIATSLLALTFPVFADETTSPPDVDAQQAAVADKKDKERKKKAIEKANGELTPEQWNAVVCQSQVRTGSRIKKRRCLSVKEWHYEADERLLRMGAQLGMEPRRARPSKKKSGT